MSRALWCVLLLGLVLLGGRAFAQSCNPEAPVTSYNVDGVHYPYTDAGQDAACKDKYNNNSYTRGVNRGLCYYGGGNYSGASTVSWCMGGNVAPVGGVCPVTTCAPGTSCDSGTGQCVSACGTDGATWNGVNCACPGIQTFNSGPKTCTCETGGRLKGTPIAGTGSVPDSACYDGCSASVGGTGISMGGVWAAELGSFTGAKCSDASPAAKKPTADTRTPEQKCLASGGGYVTTSTGTVCTSSGDSPSPVTTVKKSSDVKTVGGVTTTDETTTTCQGSQCTTVVTTKDGTGTVIGTVTSNGVADGAGGGGGGDGKTDCDKYPNTMGCSEYGDPSGAEELGTKEVGTSAITTVGVSSNSSCPADVVVRSGIKVSYEYICMYATALKPIIIALAWLSAGFMVFGMRID